MIKEPIEPEQKPYKESRINLEGGEQPDPKTDPAPVPKPEVVPDPQEPEITPGDPGSPGTNPPEQPSIPEPNESEKIRREHEFKPQMDKNQDNE